MILQLLRRQRQCFIRTADGQKIITNPVLYNQLSYQLIREQEKIGRENKRKIIAECTANGMQIPNFRREGISKA